MKRTPEQISRNMSRVRSSGSEIESIMGKAMWAAGIRYRKQCRTVFGRPDFALIGLKIAVFCDSSFWHGRGWPEAAEAIKSNRNFWIPKIERNIDRDRAVTKTLRRNGWRVFRFWDTDIKRSPHACVRSVLKAVERQKLEKEAKISGVRLLLRRRRNDARSDSGRVPRGRRH